MDELDDDVSDIWAEMEGEGFIIKATFNFDAT